MPQTSVASNPFMLMISPEVVIEAMERSERLSQLNRHLCRPLDRPNPQNPAQAEDAASAADDDADE